MPNLTASQSATAFASFARTCLPSCVSALGSQSVVDGPDVAGGRWLYHNGHSTLWCWIHLGGQKVPSEQSI